MSLRDAIQVVIEDMEAEAQAKPGRDSDPRLNAYAKQLRLMLKASEGEVQPTQQRLLLPEVQHDIEIQKAREEFRRQKVGSPQTSPGLILGGADLEEAFDGVQTLCTGGPADDNWHAIDPKMPVGGKTMVAGAVYVLKQDTMGGRFLEFSAEETAKLKARLT